MMTFDELECPGRYEEEYQQEYNPVLLIIESHDCDVRQRSFAGLRCATPEEAS